MKAQTTDRWQLRFTITVHIIGQLHPLSWVVGRAQQNIKNCNQSHLISQLSVSATALKPLTMIMAHCSQ